MSAVICKENDCQLEFDDINIYYYHLLADHHRVPCPACPNTNLHPRNFRRHLFQNHEIDWDNQQFIDAFISKFGHNESLLSFLTELSGFIPLTILARIVDKLYINLTRELDLSDDTYYIRPHYIMIPLDSYKDCTSLYLFRHEVQYLSGRQPDQVPYAIRQSISDLQKFRQSLTLENMAEIVSFGLSVPYSNQLYQFATNEIPFIINSLDDIKNKNTRLRFLFKVIPHFSDQGNSTQAKKLLTVLERIIQEEITVSKDSFKDQASILRLLVDGQYQEGIKRIEEYSERYNNYFPYFKANDWFLIGILAAKEKKYHKALKFYERANQLFEQQQDHVSFVNSSRNSTKAFLELQKYPEALENSQKTLQAISELKGYQLLELGLRLDILKIEQHIIKNNLPITLADVKKQQNKILDNIDVIEELEDDIGTDQFENYSDDELDKVATHLVSLKGSFLDLADAITKEKNKIITRELIKLGLSTFSSLDRNFDMPDPVLRERLYEILANVEKIIGYRFNHPHLLWQALLDIEGSGIKDKPSIKLAFLGDGALKLTISEILIEHGKVDLTLDELSKNRQNIEKNTNLALMFDRLELNNYILSDRKILPSEGSEQDFSKDYVIHWKGTMVESIIGAVYFDGGVAAVKRFLTGWKPQLFVNLQE